MAIPKGYRRVEGSERHAARGAKLVRAADPKETLSVTVHVRRRPGAPPLPDLNHWAAIPLDQRKFLTHQEFAAQHGAAQADLDSIAAFAEVKGLTVTDSSAARRAVVLSGTVAQMQAAFAVSLGHYKTPRESYRGREGFVHVPKEIVDLVESVLGLDNRRIANHQLSFSGISRASGPARGSPLTPVQVARLYNFPTTSASPPTIGIIELGGGYTQTDLNAFFHRHRLVAPIPIDVSVHGATNAPAGNISNVPSHNPDVEVVLDIDVAGAIAQGAPIAMYFAPNSEQGFVDAVNTAVHDATNVPSILSISWAESEDRWTNGGRTTMSKHLVEAAALGITIFVASGDTGSDGTVGDGSAHVAYPASDPGVTGCGGTYIANVKGSHFTEGTWNDHGGATGGGVSDVFLGLPAWQNGMNVPVSANDFKTVGRGVPDIAGNASPSSGYTVILYGRHTTDLHITRGRHKGKKVGTLGGTSAVAPLYAGLLAVIEATLGRRLGFLNPVLYSLADHGIFTCIDDEANNRWSGDKKRAPFYTSGPGWNPCTGLGRIDGTALLNAIAQIYANNMALNRVRLPAQNPRLMEMQREDAGSGQRGSRSRTSAERHERSV